MDPADRHLWQFRWVRDLLWIAGAVVLLALAYLSRSILAPVLIALGLAYAVNPLVVWMRRRWRFRRWESTAIVMGAVALVVLIVALVVVPPLVRQTVRLAQKLPDYARQVAVWAEVDLAQVRQQARDLATRGQPAPPQPPAPVTVEGEAPAAGDAATATPPVADVGAEGDTLAALRNLPWAAVGSVVLRGVGLGIGAVGSAIGFVTYLLLALFLIAVCFFFFSWHFEAVVEYFRQFVPTEHQLETQRIIGKMDAAVAGFIRGRVIQSLVLGTVLSIGFFFAGVPYWLLLGMGSGVLNLVPYAAFFGWPAAVILTWVDRASGGAGFAWTAVLLWPTIAYFLGQTLDNWVVEPIVQGRATALDPLSVLLAVMIGATLAGLLGMLLAIPVAACAKILFQELILPQLSARYARPRPRPPAGPPSPV